MGTKRCDWRGGGGTCDFDNDAVLLEAVRELVDSESDVRTAACNLNELWTGH